MVTAFDVHPEDLIVKTAEALKKEEAITPPVWVLFVKTGNHKERPPIEQDWWYTRAAAVLRTVYIRGPIGVSKLRNKYGGNKKRGVMPRHFRRGSGSVLRKCLQQLQNAGLVQYHEKGVRKGRIITPKGKSLLDNTAKSLENGTI